MFVAPLSANDIVDRRKLDHCLVQEDTTATVMIDKVLRDQLSLDSVTND